MKPQQAKYVDEIIARHRAINTNIDCEYEGKKITICPNVYSPFIAPSGNLVFEFMKKPIFKGKRVLDIGCGSGIVSCLAVDSEADFVVGVDINPDAIENSKLNAQKLGVESKTDFRLGDLFSSIKENEEFDIIFANLPFTDGQPKDMLEKAFYDSSLKSICRFVEELPNWLKSKDAKAYLCFSDLEKFDLQSKIVESSLDCNTFMEIDLGIFNLFIYEITKRSD